MEGNTQQESQQDDRFYSLTEAAEVLGVHYETAARWVRSGKLRGVRLSRRKVVVPRSACRSLLSEQQDVHTTGDSHVGAPHRWISLAGTLKPYEAKRLRSLIQDLDVVEEPD